MRKRKKSRAVAVYSAQADQLPPDKRILYRTSHAAAKAEVEHSHAGWTDDTHSAIRLIALNRVYVDSPSGIPASTAAALAANSPWARDKVRAWGQLQREMLAALVV